MIVVLNLRCCVLLEFPFVFNERHRRTGVLCLKLDLRNSVLKDRREAHVSRVQLRRAGRTSADRAGGRVRVKCDCRLAYLRKAVNET